MRVLQIVTHMNRGGLETMLMNYYRQIDRKQIQFDFLVHRSERADYDDEIEEMGGKIYRLPRLNPWNPSYLKAVDKFFSEHSEYQIVHSHLDCMSAIPLKAAKKTGISVRIAHSHSSNQDKDFKYFLKLYYKTRISASATKLFACSVAAGKWMFGKADFEVLPNAIDIEKYVYNEQKRGFLREKLGLKDSLVIGHVGRFSQPKNHLFLIEIFEKIYRKLPSARLLLIGDGEKRLMIEEKVQRLGLKDAVIFLGVRSDVADLMQVMDVFLFPSLYEGLPVTLIEAQAAGLPCLISDRVPIECKKTDLVQQLALSEGAEKWADRVLQISSFKRRNTYEEMKLSGYDIKDSAEKLQNFYQRAEAGDKDVCLF